MKTYLRFTPLLAVLAMSACNDDFLTETPTDFIAPESFYNNEADATAAVNAAYATFITLQSPLSSSDYLGRNFWMVAEYPTEVVTSRLSAGNERSLVDNYHTQFASSHNYLLGIWQAAYAGINRANSVIVNVPGVPMNATRRDQIVAEAKFLRAQHYYYLAGLFGGVPLKLEETTSIGGATLPRATAQETWAQIAKDLTDAAAALPASWPSSEYGRATRGAALTLLGKAYLQSAATTGTAGDYQKAADTFATVMTLGYSLDPSYASLFTGTNEQSPEVIFSLQHIRLEGLGGRISEWFAPRTSPSIYAPGPQNQFQAERAFYDSYNVLDKRKAGTWLTEFVKANGDTIRWAWTSGIQSSSRYGSTGPVPRKYLDLAATADGAEEPDVILLRYADVLLGRAEAINAMTGPTIEAYGLIDQVRARAGLPGLTPGLTQQQFRDSLSLERRYEFALEMHGIFDSRRNWPWAEARLAQSMTDIPIKNKSPFTSSTTKFDARDATGGLDDKWRLYPIPARACELNALLTQNPGWSDGICKPPVG